MDESKAVVPGVTVTITSPALQRPELTTVTDGEGRYRFAGLPSGVYAATFELAGFRTVTLGDIRLAVGFIATQDVSMAIGTLGEAITVTGESPVVDIRTTTVSTNFSREAMETVPTSRSVWQIIAMSPGMRNTATTPDVGGSMMGTQESYNNYGSGRGGNVPTIEGINVRDAGQDASYYYDFGAFEEVQIKAMGNDAEVPLSGTHLVTVVKSGGNTFHGRSLFQWNGAALQGNNIDDDLRTQGINTGNPLKSYFDFSADLGGRFIRDRLWFYGAHRRQRVRSEVIGYSGENRTDLNNTTAKLTAQINRNHRLVGFYQDTVKDYPERGGSPFVPKESTIHQVLSPKVWKGEWTFSPTNASVVNLLVGRMHWNSDWNPQMPGSGPSRYDAVTLMNSGTSLINDTSNSERANMQYTANYGVYKRDVLGGNHDFKMGVEYLDVLYAREMFGRGSDGDFQLQYQSGVPWRVVTYSNPFRATVALGTFSGFVKDSWELSDRLTFNLGVRFDRYSVSMDEQSRPGGTFVDPASFPAQDFLTWNSFNPRVALSYAVTADKRTVLKATYGRFGYFINADYGLPYNPNALVKETYLWSDRNGNNTYDRGEEGTFVSRTGGNSRVLNSDLKQPFVNEATATLERQLMTNFAARASYVYKREYQLYQLVNIARPFEAFNRPITTTDPGPDGVVGTSDDGGPITYYDYAASLRPGTFDTSTDLNPPDYVDSFHNFEFVLNRRLADRWQFLATMLVTKNNMWQTRDFADTVVTTAGVPQNPNAAAFHPKNQTTDYTFKASGSYLLPWDVLAAATYTRNSGTRYARTARFTTGLQGQTQVTLLMEPTGSQKLDDLSLLSLRAEKRVKIRSSEAAFQFDLFNALNSNVATQVVGRSGATYGRILSILPPRIGRVGVTFTF